MTCQCGPLVAGKTRQLNRNNKVAAGVPAITVSHPELHTDVIQDLEGFSPPKKRSTLENGMAWDPGWPILRKV